MKKSKDQLKKYALPVAIVLVGLAVLLALLAGGGEEHKDPVRLDHDVIASRPSGAGEQNVESRSGSSDSADPTATQQSGIFVPGESEQGDVNDPADPEETSSDQPAGPESDNPGETEPETDSTDPAVLATEVTPDDPVVLPRGLAIERVSAYTGMYVEDGSGEIVTDVMMILLRNESEQDLQLSRIKLTYGDTVFHFECTNLAAGECVVLLEKDRQTAIAGAPDASEIYDVAFFNNPMEPENDRLQLDCSRGVINVTNTSDSDITGDIYIYYKYYAAGYYYGGITFRVSIKGGLPAGETRQLTAAHFDPEGCRIVQITDGQ